MFRINSVELFNFKSFLGHHKWELSQGVGLYSITGRNDDNPRLDRNGVGKSSLLDAISWCFYGKTTRGLRSTDVVNDDCSGCSVSINLDVGSENLVIKSTHNPNSLTVNGHIVDRETVVKRLRLNHDAFLCSVIIPQFGDSFLELTPSLKLNLFSQIINLDWCLESSNKAQIQATDLEKKKTFLERELSSLSGKIDSIVSTIEDLKVKAAQWSQTRLNNIEQLALTKVSNQKKIHAFGTELQETQQFIDDLQPKIESCESIIDRKHKIVTGFDEELSEANKEIAIIKYKLSQLNGVRLRLKGIGSVCPACNQVVDEVHLNQELKRVNNEIKNLTIELSELEMVSQEIKSDKNSVLTSVSKYKIELCSHISKGSSVKSKYDSVSREIEYLKREIEGIGAKIEKIKHEKNEFKSLVEAKEKELESVQDHSFKKEKDIESLNEQFAAVSFWISGFKRLRLYIVEETLRSLEIEVNNNLELLGLVNWTISFDIERETKSGSISKGFNVFIKNSTGQDVKYETLSGGEGQRAILAATFGLSNLIMERAGLVCKTEFYDELSQHLSDAGVDDMLSCLKERAVKENKVISIVDHRSGSFADFDGVINVVKDRNGSRIETLHK